MREEIRQVDGHDDFEIGLPRTAPIQYWCTIPDQSPCRGLIFMVAGFGGDADNAYARMVRRSIAEISGVVCVTLRYHCLRARPPKDWMTVAQPANEMPTVILDDLVRVDLAQKIQLLSGSANPPSGTDAQLVATAMKLLTESRVNVVGTVQPPFGEYQNFGVLQALDHLTVLGDIINRGDIQFDLNNICCIGSSHGGYLSHLIHKFAPNTIRFVLDNSGYTEAPYDYLGFGTEYRTNVNNFNFSYRVKSHWNLDRSSKNFYSLDRYMIRDLNHPWHVATVSRASDRKCGFVIFNAKSDVVSPPKAKEIQAELLRENGHAVSLHLIGKDQIDGKIFRADTHALNASNIILFQEFFQEGPIAPTTIDFHRKTMLNFDCYRQRYVVEHIQKAPYIHVSLQPMTEPGQASDSIALSRERETEGVDYAKLCGLLGFPWR